jgi:hypothetical protein
MNSSQIPPQYDFLIRMLMEHSGGYTKQLAKISSELKSTFSIMPASFEVDVYFTFLLSASLVHMKHNHQVWKDLCFLCEDGFSASYDGKFSCDDFRRVIAARIQGYGEILKQCRESGENPGMPCLKYLHQHILASSQESRVEELSPIIISDYFDKFNLLLEYQQVDLYWAEGFSGALIHIFEHTNDIRTLSEDQLIALAHAGREEALARVAQAVKATSQVPLAEQKRWWQFWR